MCTVLLPLGDNPIAINKYIVSYHKFSSGYKSQVGYIIMNIPFHAKYRLGQSMIQLVIIYTINVSVLHWELIRPTNLTVLAQSNRRVPNLPRQEFTPFIATASFTVTSLSENACKCVEMCKTNGFISILGHQLLIALWCRQLDHHQLPSVIM